MKTTNSSISFVSILFLLSSCAPSAKESIDTAVYNHKAADNACIAAASCTPAFEEALKKFKIEPSGDFCQALLDRSDSDLTVCEIDIRKEKFSDLLTECQADLDQRLESISKIRNKGVSTQADFISLDKKSNTTSKKFAPTQTQTRDMSQGYLAVTGDVQPKQVVLTFDDGPDADNTVSVVRTLARFGVKAHFFKVGIRIEANPEITQYVASEGHSIGNHSWNHPNFREISFEEGLKQVKKTQSLLRSILGWADPFFRFPFGADTKEFDQMLNQNQMANFKWAIDSNDWKMVYKNGTVRTNMEVITDTMNQLEKQGRGIILLHDIHRRTAELLPELLTRIAEKGYQPVLLQPSNEDLKTKPPILADEDLP